MALFFHQKDVKCYEGVPSHLNSAAWKVKGSGGSQSAARDGNFRPHSPPMCWRQGTPDFLATSQPVRARSHPDSRLDPTPGPTRSNGSRPRALELNPRLAACLPPAVRLLGSPLAVRLLRACAKATRPFNLFLTHMAQGPTARKVSTIFYQTSLLSLRLDSPLFEQGRGN